MPGFRHFWRGERGRKEPESASRHAESRERPERDRERAEYGGEDFRYRPESGRHRYPEGLYSGIGRDSAGARREVLDQEPAFSTRHPRHNGRAQARWREGQELEHARAERTGDAHPDYDQDDDDRLQEEIAERTPRETREVGGLPSGPHRGRGPRGYRRSDERIREDICDRLTDDPEIDASDIEVLVADGEVTLNGSVETRLIRRLAEDVADTVSGVSMVQNNLRIGPPGGGRDDSGDETLTAEPSLAGSGLAGRRRT